MQLRTLAVLAALFAGGAVALVTDARAGKGPLQWDLGGTTLRWEFSSLPGDAGAKPQPQQERVLAIAAKNAALGYGYVPLVRPLLPPFTFETTVRAASAGGLDTASFGAQLVADDDFTTQLPIDVRLAAEGVAAAAQDATGAPLPAHEFVGTRSLDLRFDHTGTELVFSARATGDLAFTELGRRADTRTAPLYAVLQAYAVAAPAVVTFDEFRVLAAAADDAAPAGADDAFAAYDRILDALHGLDGDDADLDAVAATLDVAAARLADSRAALRGGARKKVAAAAGRVRAARKAVAPVPRSETAAKALRKALKLLDALGRSLSGR